MDFQAPARAHKTFSFICDWLLPLGYLMLLIGLAVLPDRSLYHKSFYALIAAPALIALILRPETLRMLLREPIVLLFLAFSAWSLLSISWSATETPIGSLLKRPLYVFMLFAGCSLLTRQSSRRLEQTTLIAALLMIPLTLYSLSAFAISGMPDSRLVGPGALDNPLLSSHLFGFFCIFWLALVMTLPQRQSWIAIAPLLISAITLLATGSRTPILATAIACGWLTLACWNRRSIMLVLAGALTLAGLLILYPDALVSRGTSFRLELWQDALDKISRRPWLGFGFGASLAIYIEGLATTFREPHSFAIGVLYYTGIIGLGLWLAMHLVALKHCWRQRHNWLFVIGGALLAYGIGAGLAEGGGILSRPKEHWFVTWIPLALIAALNIRSRHTQETPKLC
ncbi:O-antigen ligase [Pseudomonas sp. SJZ079]|uniref:O-antigen ligase family protein n=1 Tax=Pseudomonas sp. SJZ079 TaxID=2572887 RepID=UPI00119C466B|nr:O-antigen ligase family protein [Pseudomonas sp. SJZ079]TWC41362.1 O-antigen ligase [Pseudomonas sp. SJZ079]